MSWLRHILCLIFDQCAEIEIAPLRQRIERLERAVGRERAVTWEQLMTPNHDTQRHER